MLYKVYKLGEVFKVVFFKVGKGGKAEDYFLDVKEQENDEKLDNNLCRAKSRIGELALCNEWTHFVTLSLNGEKIDRYDLDGYIKKLGKWIEHYNRKYAVKLKYLLIPEQHKDGAWHMHGLFYGIAPKSLVKNEYGYMDMPFYKERFGYISLSPIKNKLRISNYIKKYIAKALYATSIKLCKHSFYHSQGLKGAELIHEDYYEKIPNGVWNNEYVGIKQLNSYEELKNFIDEMEKDNETNTNDRGIYS